MLLIHLASSWSETSTSPILLVSQDCLFRVLRIEWLKAKEQYCLTVLEAGNQKPRCEQHHVTPPRNLQRKPFWPLPHICWFVGNLWDALACNCMTLISEVASQLVCLPSVRSLQSILHCAFWSNLSKHKYNHATFCFSFFGGSLLPSRENLASVSYSHFQYLDI